MPPSATIRKRRIGRGNDSYLLLDGLLDSRQLEAVRKYVTTKPVKKALSQGFLFDEDKENPQSVRKSAADKQRRSDIAWLYKNAAAADADDDPEGPVIPPFLHARLRAAAQATHRTLGERLCPVGLDSTDRWTPRFEPVQYTEYGVGGHYASWHTDAELDSDDVEDLRAVTVVVLLSDTDAFQGGRFQTRIKGKVANVPLKAGDAIAFPAKRLEHRVTKVTGGKRQSLVFWVRRGRAD